uniref:Uncharacterized protein n=1 Tax=candidate division WOR-3 bacterium TaxID=2052148 RepID=A0A7C4CD23_UNCW3
MVRRTVVLALLAAAIVALPGCSKPTRVIGRLVLAPGQTGDVQNCRVELYVSSDLTGNPVKFVASEASGQANQSPFEITDVIEGYYYLLAWKDMNGDGVVSDKDIVGVHGGTYRHGYGGTQVTVTKGQTKDVGDIQMMIYKELKATASGSRSQGGTVTDFSYSFNYDVTLSKFTVEFPDEPGVEYEDPGQIGAKLAGTTYQSAGWNMGGLPMPSGNHILRFTGTWDGTAFTLAVNVSVN